MNETGEIADSRGSHEFDELGRDLEALDKVLRRFNFFRATGAARAELRHSDFLRFLLSPEESHDLGHSFLHSFLRLAIGKLGLNARQEAKAAKIREILNQREDLSDTEVAREWLADGRRLDVLILNGRLQFAVLVENKIDAAESDRQLTDYWGAVEKKYPNWSRIGLLLSPNELQPNEERDRENWIPVSYGLVRDALNDTRRRPANSDAEVAVRHYIELLGGEFMKDCADQIWLLYQRYPRALKKVQEYPPPVMLKEAVRNLVNQVPTLRIDWEGQEKGKEMLHFCPVEWDQLVNTNNCVWWFRFEDFRETLALNLVSNRIDPHAARRLAQIAEHHSILFRVRDLGGLTEVWRREFLSVADLKRLSRAETIDRIESAWREFMTKDLQGIMKACREG